MGKFQCILLPLNVKQFYGHGFIKMYVTVYYVGFVFVCADGYENLAYQKPAWQSTSHDSTVGSEKAVDGLKNDLSYNGKQCSISRGGTTATWRVNLQSIQSISSIIIYYRTDNVKWDASNDYTRRFLGFYVYVSNTTNRLDGHLCFHDTNYTRDTIPAVVNISCSVHGQHVIYYNERLPGTSYPPGYHTSAFTELCEVEVYGCSAPRLYGSNCSLPCPTNCKQYCHIESGNCLQCSAGYEGERCEQQCGDRQYGQDCGKNCGDCLDYRQCDHIDGTCPDGCDRGYFGTLCKKECPWGLFGINCSESCGNTCNGCDKMDGTCDYGCYIGWKGTFCNETCDDLKFGENCTEKCGFCLNGKQCHHINGSCPGGCDQGHQGTFCKQSCLPGTFGKNCKENCSSNCANSRRCDSKDGECEGGCKPGWEGLQCNTVCSEDTFGQNCTQTCGKCLNITCHHINGSCKHGCQRGFEGYFCRQSCRNNKYGYNCVEDCRKECLNSTCSPIDGVCIYMYEQTQEGSPSTSLIAGGISGGLIAVLMAVIVIVALKRCRSQKNENETRKTDTNPLSTNREFQAHFSSIDSPKTKGNYILSEVEKTVVVKKKSGEVDVDDDEIKHSENPYGEIYINETTIPDIPLKQLEFVIAEKRKHEDDGFQKEYFGLPYGERHRCDAGKRDENIVKNRFKTTFPYDHSRVILGTASGSDYINANYIEGAKREKEYIAAQGPKQNTVGDFWIMIWQENVSVIVMLTNLREGNKIKCTQYWPDLSKHINYGVVSVKMMEEKEYAFFIIRKLSVTHKESKKSRVVTQFHYTSWPDHGTPDPLCLVVFLDHVTRTGRNQTNSPTVVHCSAGIGRTGTYIALDVLNQIGKKTGKVNVAEYVKKMREDRMNMVQTYEQYITIFLALNEIFKSSVNTMTAAEFANKAETMITDKPANQSALRKEFQLLMKIRPTYTDSDYKLANQDLGDVYSNVILPLDKYSLHLSSVVPKRGNFINAICVPSFINSKAFIVTHYPPTEDAVDFLRLLNDHESDTVICMDPLNGIESSKVWLPSPSSYKSVPPYTIHCQSKSGSDVRNTTIHILQTNTEEEAHPVMIIEPKVTIKTSGNPLDTSQLRSLVSAAVNLKTDNPITVISSDGASLCGVFCAVHNVIQQINMDNSVDVFTAVRQLQVRRPEFCSNLDEYCLVVKTVYDYIQNSMENIYCNQ